MDANYVFSLMILFGFFAVTVVAISPHSTQAAQVIGRICAFLELVIRVISRK